MKKFTAGSLAALALVAVMFSTARADDHTSPGTPGSPDCRGQTIAWLAQMGKEGHLMESLQAMGLGGLARSNDVTVAEVHQIVDAICSFGP
jgi:hypothetical protein